MDPWGGGVRLQTLIAPQSLFKYQSGRVIALGRVILATLFLTAVWLDPEDLAWGAIQNRYARAVFAWCNQHSTWPGYQPDLTKPPQAVTVQMPVWARRKLQEDFEAGRYTPPQESLETTE